MSTIDCTISVTSSRNLAIIMIIITNNFLSCSRGYNTKIFNYYTLHTVKIKLIILSLKITNAQVTENMLLVHE